MQRLQRNFHGYSSGISSVRGKASGSLSRGKAKPDISSGILSGSPSSIFSEIPLEIPYNCSRYWLILESLKSFVKGFLKKPLQGFLQELLDLFSSNFSIYFYVESLKNSSKFISQELLHIIPTITLVNLFQGFLNNFYQGFLSRKISKIIP